MTDTIPILTDPVLKTWFDEARHMLLNRKEDGNAEICEEFDVLFKRIKLSEEKKFQIDSVTNFEAAVNKISSWSKRFIGHQAVQR